MAQEKRSLVDALNDGAGKKIAFLGADDSVEEVEVIPTGIMPLDFIIGAGGVPRGGITDIYGLPSVGKSTLSFTLIAQAQRMGLQCALVDAEYSYSPDYVRTFGVDTASLLVIQPDCLEEAATAIEATIRQKYGLIVVDSISALVPRALAEADHGKAPMAMQARGISSMLQKIVAPLKKNKTALVCINQMRVNIMAMHAGDKYTVTGGFALKFYSLLRVEIKRLKGIMKKDELAGYVIGFKVVKNKIGRPGRTCETQYLFGEGFGTDGDLVEMALEAGLIQKEGTAYYIVDGKKLHGKEKASLAIEGDPPLKERIIAALFPQQSPQ
jgi:recombination protein RecA